jgi:CheY-like chemotaxis protein
MNLAVNARDAMPSGGELRMETRNVDVSSEYARLHHEVEPGRYVVLTVGDTGVGMDEETQARIFEPFFTTKEAGKGTGLGLATVYGIVHQLGGFVWVYSEPGGGTTFKLYFRRVSDTVDDTVDTEPIEAYDPLGTESVLVVEDDPSVREAVQQMLELHGYRVVAAEDPDAAEVLTMASSEAFDLLLTDVVMPIRSGKELADRLRVLNPRLKVVFMSGYTDHEVVHRGVLDEGVMFIEKPFSADMLARVIRRTLGE